MYKNATDFSVLTFIVPTDFFFFWCGIFMVFLYKTMSFAYKYIILHFLSNLDVFVFFLPNCLVRTSGIL